MSVKIALGAMLGLVGCLALGLKWFREDQVVRCPDCNSVNWLEQEECRTCLACGRSV